MLVLFFIIFLKFNFFSIKFSFFLPSSVPGSLYFYGPCLCNIQKDLRIVVQNKIISNSAKILFLSKGWKKAQTNHFVCKEEIQYTVKYKN